MPTKPQPTATKQQLSTNNYLIVVALVSLLVLGAGVLISRNLIKSIVLDSKVVTATSNANKTLEADVDAAPKLVNNYQSLAPSTASILKNSLPNTEDFPGLVSLLETASGTAGISFTSIAPDVSPVATVSPDGAPADTAAPNTSGSVNPPAPQTSRVIAQVTGSYTGLFNLLTNMEHSARPIRITSLEVTGSGSTLIGNIGLTTYYQDKASLPFGTEVKK